MALIKCSECGKEISDKAPKCPNCGCPSAYFLQATNVVPQSNTQNVQQQSNALVNENPKRSPLGIVCILFGLGSMLFSCTPFGLVLAFIALVLFALSVDKKLHDKKDFTIGLILAVIAILIYTFVDSNSSKTSSENVAETEITNTISSIDDFDYTITNDGLLLSHYNGSEDIVVIPEAYTIDGNTYPVVQLETSIFNLTSVYAAYFPKSLNLVYDETLCYMDSHADHIYIYYGGSQDDWNNIFTEYVPNSISQEWNEKDAGGLGRAMADKVNDMIGHDYDPSMFTIIPDTSIDNMKYISIPSKHINDTENTSDTSSTESSETETQQQ